MTALAHDALKFLMEQHDLNQNDLKNEIGSQGVVSQIFKWQTSIECYTDKKTFRAV